MLNINEIRSQFPILSKKKSEKQFVYFDNAATTHKPTQVINSINIKKSILKKADKIIIT